MFSKDVGLTDTSLEIYVCHWGNIYFKSWDLNFYNQCL